MHSVEICAGAERTPRAMRTPSASSVTTLPPEFVSPEFGAAQHREALEKRVRRLYPRFQSQGMISEAQHAAPY